MSILEAITAKFLMNIVEKKIAKIGIKAFKRKGVGIGNKSFKLKKDYRILAYKLDYMTVPKNLGGKFESKGGKKEIKELTRTNFGKWYKNNWSMFVKFKKKVKDEIGVIKINNSEWRDYIIPISRAIRKSNNMKRRKYGLKFYNNFGSLRISGTDELKDPNAKEKGVPATTGWILFRFRLVLGKSIMKRRECSDKIKLILLY